jgi:hypothetical protein
LIRIGAGLAEVRHVSDSCRDHAEPQDRTRRVLIGESIEVVGCLALRLSPRKPQRNRAKSAQNDGAR